MLAQFERDRDYLTFWNDWPMRMQSVADCRAFILNRRRAFAEEKDIPAAMIFKGKFVGLSTLEIQERRVV